MTNTNPYWQIVVEESFGNNNIVASSEQIAAVVSDMISAKEMEYEASGNCNIPNPLVSEIDRLRKALVREANAIWCKECKGTGNIITGNAMWECRSSCDKCAGSGKVYDR